MKTHSNMQIAFLPLAVMLISDEAISNRIRGKIYAIKYLVIDKKNICYDKIEIWDLVDCNGLQFISRRN